MDKNSNLPLQDQKVILQDQQTQELPIISSAEGSVDNQPLQSEVLITQASLLSSAIQNQILQEVTPTPLPTLPTVNTHTTNTLSSSVRSRIGTQANQITRPYVGSQMGSLGNALPSQGVMSNSMDQLLGSTHVPKVQPDPLGQSNIPGSQANSNYTLIDTNTLQALLQQNDNLMHQNRELTQSNREILAELRHLIQTLAIHKPHRQLPLGKYHLDRGETLLQFLNRFEQYVRVTYPDSPLEEWGTFLEGHLDGEIKRVYEVLVKSSVGYTHLKNNLLIWFKEQVIKEEQNYMNQFYEAVIQPSETVPLFALRLLGLAENAFPGNDPKNMKLVRDKFLNCLTPQQQQQVRSQITCCQVMSKGVPISWETLVHLVDQTVTPPTASQAPNLPTNAIPTSTSSRTEPTPPPQPEVIDLNVAQPSNILTQEYYNQNYRQPNYTYSPGYTPESIPYLPYLPNVYSLGPAQNNPPSYAQMAAQPHQNTQPPSQPPSWPQPNNAKGSGRQQRQQQTRTSSSSSQPNTQQNRRGSRSSQPRSPRPNDQEVCCNYCKEPGHDVRQCTKRPYCHFCGKRGHVASECYTAEGKCIHCKTLGHLVQDCPTRKQRRESRIDTPCCPYCKGGHLGMNCQQRPPPGN